jgi:endonuclease-3
VRAVVRRLDGAYGPFEPKPALDPLDGLVLTVLSQATNDRNSSLAFARLKARFPTWGEVLAAPLGEVESAIRPGGLSRTKARVIGAILGELRSSPTGLDLRHLAGVPARTAMGALTALPGVGLKTAACVLLFDLGRPVMPVDTHVHRISRRLGLVAERATPDQTHAVLTAITPEALVYRLHVWLIAHGRAVCRARTPRCDGCVLAGLCPVAAASKASSRVRQRSVGDSLPQGAGQNVTATCVIS